MCYEWDVNIKIIYTSKWASLQNADTVVISWCGVQRLSPTWTLQASVVLFCFFFSIIWNGALEEYE